MKRVICFILIFTLLFSSFCVTALAAGDISSDIPTGYVVTDLWSDLIHKGIDVQNTINDTLAPILGMDPDTWTSSVWSALDPQACFKSDDGYHHCTKVSSVLETTGSNNRPLFKCICDYCGETYNVDGESAKSAYNDMVDGLPYQSIRNDGSFFVNVDFYGWYTWRSSTINFNSSSSDYYDFVMPDYMFLHPASGSSQTSINYAYYKWRTIFPVDGFYSTVGDCYVDAYAYLDSSVYSSHPVASLNRTYYTSGRVYVLDYRPTASDFGLSSDGIDYAYYYFRSFRLLCEPVSPIDPNTGTDYNINNRIFNISPSISFNGTTVENKIINETTNQFYNITNNTTYNIQNWIYDYSNMTYNLNVKDDSDVEHTVVVNYGDESVTVTFDGESSTYVYINIDVPEGGGSGESGSAGTDVSGLEKLLQAIKDKLDEILEAIGLIDSGDNVTNNNVHVEGDTIIQDSDGESKEYSIPSIIGKFSFIGDIFSIGRELVSVVSSDAAAAYDYDFAQIKNSEEDSSEDAVSYAMPLSDDDALSVTSLSSGAPSIVIDLGAAQSHYGYNYGGYVEVLDLSWYTPYKESVDKLLSGFLWVVFLWTLFRKVPGIISGSSLDSEKLQDIKNGER